MRASGQGVLIYLQFVPIHIPASVTELLSGSSLTIVVWIRQHIPGWLECYNTTDMVDTKIYISREVNFPRNLI